ncbi:MAG: cation channel family, partial [Trebouxia sp. A1-2]
GNNLTDEYGPKSKNEPRRSWMMRKRQERAAMKEGLAEWQANPYFCAGRVTVPALMDTVACQCFINTGMLTDLLTEFAGDDGRAGGALLRQIDLPPEMVGRTYGELVQRLTLHRKLVPLGLYRRKSENSAWRLQYVATNPPWHERLEISDRVFVLRERGGPWLAC